MELYRFINLIFLCTVNGFFSLAGIFLNSVVVICLWRATKLRKGTGNFMILVLSSFDLLVIVVAHPAVILNTLSWSRADNSSAHWSTKSQSDGYRLAETAILLSNYTKYFALSTILAMTVDRYLAITRPFFHKIHVTKRRLLAFTVTLQLLIIGVATFRFFKDLKVFYYIAGLVVLGTDLILLTVMNYRMFRIAARGKRHEQASKTQLALLKKNCTCLLAVACFFVFLSPLILYTVLRLTSSGLLSEDALALLRLWGNTSFSMSSTWNCVIFFWRNEILRNAGKKLLTGCLKLRR